MWLFTLLIGRVYMSSFGDLYPTMNKLSSSGISSSSSSSSSDEPSSSSSESSVDLGRTAKKPVVVPDVKPAYVTKGELAAEISRIESYVESYVQSAISSLRAPSPSPVPAPNSAARKVNHTATQRTVVKSAPIRRIPLPAPRKPFRPNTPLPAAVLKAERERNQKFDDLERKVEIRKAALAADIKELRRLQELKHV